MGPSTSASFNGKPAAPGEAKYSCTLWRDSYQGYGLVGPEFRSNLPAAAHRLDARRNVAELGGTAVHGVKDGVSTLGLDNIGFVIKKGTTSEGGAMVTIYPYQIDRTKPASLYDNRIEINVKRLCEEFLRDGVTVAGERVAPQTVVGHYQVLDFHGQRPAALAPEKPATPLRDVNFKFRG